MGLTPSEIFTKIRIGPTPFGLGSHVISPEPLALGLPLGPDPFHNPLLDIVPQHVLPDPPGRCIFNDTRSARQGLSLQVSSSGNYFYVANASTSAGSPQNVEVFSHNP